MADTPAKKKRPLLRAFLVLVLLAIALVALAPTLLSLGLARGLARDAIAKKVSGTVDLQGVSLGWLSGQSVSGLRIADQSGTNVLAVDVSLDSGLLALIASGGSSIDISVSGSAKGTIEADGSNGLAKLLQAPAGATPPSQPSGSGSGSGGIPAGLRASLAVGSFNVELTDVARKRTYALNGLQGIATLDEPSGTLGVDLKSGTNFLGGAGALSLAAKVTGLSGATIDLPKLGVDLSIKGSDLRIPAGDQTADFSTVDMAVRSAGLGQSLTVDAKAEGKLDGSTASTLAANLSLDKPIGADGSFSVDGAGLKGTVEASRLPTALAQPFLARTAIVLSEDLGPTIEHLVVKAPGGGSEPITIDLKAPKAQLMASAVVDPAGAIREGSLEGALEASPATLERLAKVSSTGPAKLALHGKHLAWAKPAAGASPLSTFVGNVDLAPTSPVAVQLKDRDIAIALGQGGKVSVSRAKLGDPLAADVALALGFGSASAPAAAPSAPNLTAHASLSENFDRLENGTARFTGNFEPAFLAAATGRTFTAALPITLTVNDLDAALPPRGAEGLSIDAKLEMVGESGLYAPELSRDVRFGDVTLSIQAADAAKEANIVALARIEKGQIAVRELVRSLPKDFAGIDPLALDMRGTIDIAGLDGPALAAWLPEQRPMIEAAGVQGLSLNVKNEPLPGKPGQRLAGEIGGQPVHGSFRAGLQRSQVAVEILELQGTIGRELVAHLQSDRSERARVAKDVPFTLALGAPTTFVFEDLKAGQLPSGLTARLTLPETVVSEAPGLHSALALRNLDTTIVVESATAAKAQGNFSAVGITSPTDRIEAATFDLAWHKPQGETLLQGLSGEIKLAGVSLPWVEALIGQPKGRISTWTGDSGNLQAVLSTSGSTEQIRLTPAFPRLAGSLAIDAKGEAIDVQATNVAVRIDAATLGTLVTKPGTPAGATRYAFQGDLVAKLTAGTVNLPKGLAKGGFSLAGAGFDLGLESEPLGVQVLSGNGQGQRLDVPALVTKLQSKDLAQGLTLQVNDRGTAPGAATAPSVALQGAVRGLVDPKGQVDASKAVLDLDATVKTFPTVIVDIFAGTSGKLTRSIGDTVDLTAKAQGLSKQAGQLAVNLKAPFAQFSAPSVVVKDGVATVTSQAPVTASLAMSPGLKEDILYVINPLFADIDTAKKLTTLNMPALAYPLDGDMSRFNGEFTLDVGEVSFKNGQTLGMIFSLMKDKAAMGLDGLIEPLAVKATNGVVRYDRFGVKLGKVTAPSGTSWKTALDMKGEIDLGKKPAYVNGITFALPASQVGNFSADARRFFEKLGGADSDAAKALSIGVTLFGPLYDAQGKRIPLEMKAALPTIEDLAKDPGAIIGEGIKIFEGIQKQKDEKKKQQQQDQQQPKR